MKIFHRNRLVDITGFHQASAEGQKLVISYPMAPTGRIRFPDEFLFRSEDSAVSALTLVSQYCHTDRIIEFAENEGGKFVACPHAICDC
jgi:hypothetical protein